MGKKSGVPGAPAGTALSRRSFLKTAGAAVGTAALAGGASVTALAADYSHGQKESGTTRLAHGVCRPNCFGFCNINLHVRDGKVVKTSKWQLPDTPEYTRICQRGLTHAERIYNEERLKYPLRRVEGTERGAGQWERISWDEAIDELASKIQEYQGTYGKQAVIFGSLTGNYGNLVTNMYGRLTNLLDTSLLMANNDVAMCYSCTRMTGQFRANEFADVVNADTVIVYGANITDSQVHHWHFLKEAQQGGTKLIVVDPAFTVLAARADKWIPIRPGADTLLYLGLANIVYSRGGLDEDYLRNYSVAPFLVRSDTGMYLRDEQGRIMVVENGVPIAAEEAQAPELFAQCEVDGVTCATALKLQMDAIAQWTPEVVAEKTDIPVEVLEELANHYVTEKVTSVMGYGPSNYINGAQATGAGLLLSALSGNFGKSGCGFGSTYWSTSTLDTSFANPVPKTVPGIIWVDWINVMQSGQYLGQDFPIKMAYIYCANPLNTAPCTGSYRDEIFPMLDFIVVADTAMTDTARYADLVLPAAQHFEVVDFTSQGCYFAASYSEKTIDPPYEAKADSDIVRLLADKLGLGGHFTQTDEEVCRQLLETPENIEAGLTWDALKSNGFMRMEKEDMYIAGKVGTPLLTPTGRFEFYNENPMQFYGPLCTKVPTEEDVATERMLARWEEPSEAWYEGEAMQKYPFVFMSFRGRYRIHSQYHTVQILHELDPEPILYINPADAQAKGIKDGGYVEAFNDRGHGVGKAVYSEGIRPGTVVYPKGWQLKHHKAGSWSELLNPDFSLWSGAHNFPDCVCDIRPWAGEGEE